MVLSITHIKKHVHVHVLRRSINMNVISRYSVINLISNKETNTVILPYFMKSYYVKQS